MIRRLLWFRREFCRLFAEQWPKGAILYEITQLAVLALSIALQVAAQLLRGPVKREGPRLDDLSATGVQPGAIIPRPHGHAITTGQVIAQTRIKETKKKEKTGGKGGPSVETTTYSYSIPAVAVGFSSRRMGGIIRIKANEKVIYEQITDAGLVHRNFDEIEIFLGAETQAPSAILEAHEGVGNVPAYRGTAYFVLKDLQLADFGNRMPAFKVECAEQLDAGDPVLAESGPPTTPASLDFAYVDWTRERFYALAGDDTFLNVYSIDTMTFVDEQDLTAFTPDELRFGGIDPETGYLVGENQDTGGTRWFHVYDPVAKSMVTLNDIDAWPADEEPWAPQSAGPYIVITGTDGNAALLVQGDTDIRVYTFPGLVYQTTFDTPDGAWTAGNPWQALYLTNGDAGEAIGGWLKEEEIQFRRFTISAGVVSEVTAGTLAKSDLHASKEFFIEDNTALHFDPVARGAHLTVGMLDSGDSFADMHFAVGWNLDDQALIYSTEIENDENSLGEHHYRTNTRLSGGRWIFDIGLDYVPSINLGTGALTKISIPELADVEYVDDATFWNDISGCLYTLKNDASGQLLQRRCFTFTSGETSIGLILRAAMMEWTPDVSPLIEGDHFEIDAALFADPFLVTGATFAQLMSPREVAEQCMLWKPCIFFEGGDLIKFKPRDGSKVATIRHQDMGQRGRSDEVKSTVVTTRADDAQLPREVRIKFLDKNRLFSANTAYARITRSRSSLVQENDLQFAGVPSEAKFAAWTAMGEAYAQRREMKASLPLKYFILEPSDVIELPDNDGNLIECRLAQAELGANWIIDVKANDHVNSYDDITFAAEASAAGAPALVLPKAPLTFVLDLPRLTDDAELDDGLQLVWGLGGTYEAWKGGVLYRDTLSGGGETAFGEDFGDEETSFEEVGETPIGVDAGKITTPPSGNVDEFTVDRISVMRVTFDTALPDFASLSDGQFLTGLGNVFAIGNDTDGWEIVQAQVATKVSDQVWDFSTLRRGLRGTEWAIGQAEAGDIVVRLETATLQRDAFAAGDIGTTLTYRGVTFNMDVTTAEDTDVLVVGRGLIPYSPLLGEVYRDGAGEITGTVYARALQADDADQFFLAGADFEIDIKDGPGGTVLRTLELTDTGDFTYSVADQTTDFGDTEATVDAEMFQLDDDGARGYGREVIL